MEDEYKSATQCTEFDRLLPDAIDGLLQGGELARFEKHLSECGACASLYAETKQGHLWLTGLEEVEPPRHMVHNILLATSGVAEQGAETVRALRPGLGRRCLELLHELFAPLMTPRFAGTVAMAFFSISLLLNITGIRVTDLRARTLSHSYYEAENRAIKFYENMHFVYQIQSKVRTFRRTEDDGTEKREQSSPRSNTRHGSTSGTEAGGAESSFPPAALAVAVLRLETPALGGPGMHGRNQ